MSKVRGLFDEQFRLEKLSKKNDLLKKLSRHIDFEFFRKTLSVLRDADATSSKVGRPGYDEVLMFKHRMHLDAALPPRPVQRLSAHSPQYLAEELDGGTVDDLQVADAQTLYPTVRDKWMV